MQTLPAESTTSLAALSLPGALQHQGQGGTCSVSVAASYVASLGFESGRASMRSAFIRAAGILAPSQEGYTWHEASMLPWHCLDGISAAGLRAVLASQVEGGKTAPATANRIMAAVRGALRFAWRFNMISRDDADRAADALTSFSGSRPPAGRHIDRGEMAALFAALAADDAKAARRDAAVFALMAVGMRRAEVAGLDLGSIDQQTWHVQIAGKGGKIRRVHLSNGARLAVEHYLASRGSEPGALFQARHGQRMTAQAMRLALQRRCRAACIAAVSPHDFRRTFAGEALSRGIDLPTVQAIMGHERPQTTSRYDRRPEQTRMQAMEAVCIPYLAPGKAA